MEEREATGTLSAAYFVWPMAQNSRASSAGPTALSGFCAEGLRVTRGLSPQLQGATAIAGASLVPAGKGKASGGGLWWHSTW